MAQEHPTLTLTEGNTYRFDQSDSTNSNHPLRISTTAEWNTWRWYRIYNWSDELELLAVLVLTQIILQRLERQHYIIIVQITQVWVVYFIQHEQSTNIIRIKNTYSKLC